ncbi:Carboxylesterase [Necator americanus]|uniref:Carboxylesterase n=1 Tax=Necator americanus TaxID=51031 RepID=W2T6I0_NECAM|nr:Carboxylesterase [Necator americanus]ETN77620.1 Carboxylesterase [Necator americanus]
MMIYRYTDMILMMFSRMPNYLLILWLAVGATGQILYLDPGSVQGFIHTTKSGPAAEVFLNIPYAAPPVGELRFEKPSPPIPWSSIRDGTKFGHTCHPHTKQAAVQPPPSEDCLTLNIIRPKKEAPKEGYPILLWVHGGGYEIGSTSIYGFRGFADIYIPHDVIVVTIQYRLGVYGFFSTGDSRIPGNLGLYDMAAAVKFVHANAPKFGGDRTRITAWGLSAGGSAVGQLALSPLTRDYIAGSIEMSGTPWASWAIGPTVANNSLHLAKALGCEGKGLKDCMKHATVRAIYDAVLDVLNFIASVVCSYLHGYTKHGLDCIKWGPVIDGEFLQHPDEMVATAPPKPSIVGVSDKDASFFNSGVEISLPSTVVAQDY